MHSCVQKSLIVPVFLGLVGCAGASGTHLDRSGLDPLFRVETVEPQPGAKQGGTPVSARGAKAFGIETRLARADGAVISAPRLTVYAGRRAHVTVIDQISYIETFEVQTDGPDFVADPVIGVLSNGILFEVCVTPDGDDAALAYRALVSGLAGPIPTRNLQLAADTTVTVQLPRTVSSEVAGVRRVTPGLWTRVATLATSEGEVDVRVRVVPADVVVPDFEDRASEVFLGQDSATHDAPVPDFPAEGSEDLALADWVATGGDDLRVAVDALVLDAAAPLDEVIELAGGDRWGAADAQVLGRMELTTRAVHGASMRMSLREAYVGDYDVVVPAAVAQPEVLLLRSGIAATLAGRDAEGRDWMQLSWSTSPRWRAFTTQLEPGLRVSLDAPERCVHAALVPFDAGSRLVTLGRTPDGGTLALRVTVAPAQRRVASQTHATRNRTPSGVSAR